MIPGFPSEIHQSIGRWTFPNAFSFDQKKPPERLYARAVVVVSDSRRDQPALRSVILLSEGMANANRGTPIGVQDTSGSAFDVGPDVGRVREIEVGTKAVFNPRVLAVDFNNAGAAGSRTRDLAVAKEFVNDRCAEIDITLVVRALDARGKAGNGPSGCPDLRPCSWPHQA